MLFRFKVLAESASMDSWEKALALHAEMNSHGLELPPSELIEFIEVTSEEHTWLETAVISCYLECCLMPDVLVGSKM